MLQNGFLISSGCLLISRFPIEQHHQMVFKHRSRFMDYGFRADGLAAKGVLHARLLIDDSSRLDVYVTHLEARDDKIRQQQFLELVEFIRQTADGSFPLLLMGDLNTRGNISYQQDSDSQYHKLMRSLKQADPGLVDLWASLHGLEEGGTSEQSLLDGGRRIDYILLANPPGVKPLLLPTGIRVEPFIDPEVEALSDHSAVIANFVWRP